MDDLAATTVGRSAFSPDGAAGSYATSPKPHVPRLSGPPCGRQYALQVHHLPGYRTERADRSELPIDEHPSRGRGGRRLRTGARARRRARRQRLRRRPRRARRRALRMASGPPSPTPRAIAVIAGFPPAPLGPSRRACTRTRASGTPPGFDRPTWDYERTLGARRVLGTHAGQPGDGPRGKPSCSSAWTPRWRPRLEAYGPARTIASGSSTPTSGSPICSSTKTTCT